MPEMDADTEAMEALSVEEVSSTEDEDSDFVLSPTATPEPPALLVFQPVHDEEPPPMTNADESKLAASVIKACGAILKLTPCFGDATGPASIQGFNERFAL